MLAGVARRRRRVVINGPGEGSFPCSRERTGPATGSARCWSAGGPVLEQGQFEEFVRR